MSIKEQAFSGVKWTTVSTIILAISALVKISVLARFLEPSDFGLMALITFVLGFMDLFMDMGITSAILHKQNIKEEEYSSLYWLNVMFSLFLFLLIVVLSPFIASFYDELRLNKLIPLTSLVILFSAVGRQFKTILQKELKFRTMAIIDIFSVSIALVAAIIFAANGFGVYALIYSALIQYGINNILYFIIGTKRSPLRFHFRYFETRPFLKIGIYQVGGQVINYINRDLDVLIIGKFFGAEILGGYSLAKQLARRPLMVIAPIIIRVATSILPRFQNNNIKLLDYPKKNIKIVYYNGNIDKDSNKDYILKILKSTSTLNAFIYGVMALFAPVVVRIMYGEEYIYITPIFILFTIVMYFRFISGLIGILSITKGRTDLEFYWNLLIAFVMPLIIFMGINGDIETIVLLIGIAQLLLTIPMWYMFYFKLIKMPFLYFIEGVLSPFMIALTMYGLVRCIGVDYVIFKLFVSVLLLFFLLLFMLHSDKEILSYIKSIKYVKPYLKNKHK